MAFQDVWFASHILLQAIVASMPRSLPFDVWPIQTDLQEHTRGFGRLARVVERDHVSFAVGFLGLFSWENYNPILSSCTGEDFLCILVFHTKDS